MGKGLTKRRAMVRLDLAAIVTGTGLGLTLSLLAATLTKEDLTGTFQIITTISRVAALAGAYLALLGLLLVARITWIERAVGHDRLVSWHRKSAPYSLFLILIHVLLVAVGYAANDKVRVGVEIWRLVTSYPWMLPAFVGFLAFMAAGISSYKRVRSKIKYETWWTIHLYTYIAIAFSFMHQVLTGVMFIGHPLNRGFWIFLYSAMVFSILFWRFGIPIYRSLRHGLRVDRVVVEAPGIISVIMRGRDLQTLAAQGGQFFGWRFLAKGHALISHPYSLSAAPTAHYMRITVKDLGDHSRSLAFLKRGTRVFVEGPYGAFTAGRATRPHVVMVGGGVGITPIRALMDEFKNGVQMDVIYRVSRKEDLVLKEELDYLQANSGGTIRVHYLVGSRKDHPMDAVALQELVPRVADSDIYICGPGPLVETVKQAAEDLGVPKNRFHDEAFAFHSE